MVVLERTLIGRAEGRHDALGALGEGSAVASFGIVEAVRARASVKLEEGRHFGREDGWLDESMTEARIVCEANILIIIYI